MNKPVVLGALEVDDKHIVGTYDCYADNYYYYIKWKLKRGLTNSTGTFMFPYQSSERTMRIAFTNIKLLYDAQSPDAAEDTGPGSHIENKLKDASALVILLLRCIIVFSNLDVGAWETKLFDAINNNQDVQHLVEMLASIDILGGVVVGMYGSSQNIDNSYTSGWEKIVQLTLPGAVLPTEFVRHFDINVFLPNV